MKRTLKKLCSLLCVFALVSGMLPAVAAAEADTGNLLENSSFETGSKNSIPGWTLTGGAGQQSNNPHTGGKGFYLDKGSANVISQTVTAPYSGFYLNSAYIATGGGGSVYGVKDTDGATLASTALASGATYAAPHLLTGIELHQGDAVTVYVSGGNAWVNGDDIFVGYDFSRVDYDLLAGETPTGGDTLSVRLPWTGDYLFSAEMTAGEDPATVSTGDDTYTVPAGESKTVDGTLRGRSKDDVLALVFSAGCTVSNVSLRLDLSSIPNEAPVAGDVALSGTLHSGLVLVGSYTFTDTDSGQGGNEGTSTFRWLAADTADGAYAPIEGENSKTLTLTDAQAGKYIQFEVTPVDGYGLAGVSVRSEAAGPAVINYIRNTSLDIETSQQPTGWASKNGGSMPNNKDAARTGFRLARIPGADADAEVYYTADLPITANYTAGAYVKTTSALGTLGVRNAAGEVLAEINLPDTTGAYQFVALPAFAVEGGSKVQFYLRGAEGCAQIDADDFQMLYKDQENLPEFVTLRSFHVENQVGIEIDSEARTIAVTVPYGTGVTALEVTAQVSDGAAITPASGSRLDFTEPVAFTITNGSTSAVWTVIVTVDELRLILSSDNKTLEDGFNWAVRKTNQFVMTGIENGPINVPQASGQTADYIPSYWCGYYDRTAFYSRDFVHQAVGAQIVGLWNENYSMFHTFAGFASAERKWYTGWAFNFDGSIYTMDYKSDTNFVREVPAQFELVEKAYKQYLWSGDRRYIEDETMWNFYTKVMTDYVTLHDTNGNGIAEGTAKGIFSGTCSYNERGDEPIIEAGDAIGSQYQATLAYAAMLKERGEDAASQEWYAKAAELKRYFNEEWSVVDGVENAIYARALDKDNTKKYYDFGKENSWFMPMKLITEPGARNDAYLDFIAAQVGSHIGDKSGSPSNIEAWTYLPDTFFPYNRANEAWNYMKYILSVKDNPHERPIQGTNGDYPEISYTFLTHTIEGMMGMEADAYHHKVATAPRLPDEVGNVEAKYIQMGDHVLDLAHEGLSKSTLTNDSEHDLTWEIRFYGEYPGILVDGYYTAAQQKTVNGVTVSYVTVTVTAGGCVSAEAALEEPAQTAHNVTIAETAHGTVTTDKATAFESETVTLTATPDALYVLASGSLQVNGGAVALTPVSDDTYSFTMPGADVLVTAVFQSESEPPLVPVEQVALNQHTLSLYSNASPGSATLTAAVTPENANNRTVVWSSGNESVATVSQAGLVTAHGNGTAVITAAADGKFDTCTVTVSTYTAPYVPPADSGTGAKPAPEEEIRTNADGSTTKTVTDKTTGSVTATTTYPSGKVVETVTAKDGGKTIAVTAPGGGKVAELKLPATVPAPNQPFTDIPDGHWAKSAVDFVTGMGLFNGTGGGTFSDSAPMTRGMLTTVLYRLSGELPSGSVTFGDVNSDAWYASSVAWAAQNGIVTGVSEYAFAPDANITRESLAVILYRYAGLLALDTTADHAALAPFGDSAGTSAWAGDAMAWAVNNGILTGKAGGVLAPTETATRAEVAAMLQRFILLLK